MVRTKNHSFSLFEFLLVFFFFPFGTTYGQKPIVRNIDSTISSQQLDSLRTHFGKFKTTTPKTLELPIYLALSYFPELQETSITFKSAKISTTMNARPSLGSLLFKRKKRYSFVVRINSRIQDSIIRVEHVPFNAQIGLFGHEFCHFIDYQKKESFHVLKRLFSYGSKRKKEQFEKEIDFETIKRGLGWQLYDWSSYVLENSNSTKEYKDFKRTIYLEPVEIVQEIQRLFQ